MSKSCCNNGYIVIAILHKPSKFFLNFSQNAYSCVKANRNEIVSDLNFNIEEEYDMNFHCFSDWFANFSKPVLVSMFFFLNFEKIFI